MSKVTSWVLVAGLALGGCGPTTQTGWTDWDGGWGGGSGSGGSSGGGAGAQTGSGGSSGSGSSGTTSACVQNSITEGSRMTPGDTCVSCHANSGGEAQTLSIGGTVYPTTDVATLCNGVNVTGAQVVITDANNAVLTLPVNSVGNFYTSASIKTPYTASVTYNGNTLSMMTPQTSGDCNACHTPTGANGAPGRVMLP